MEWGVVMFAQLVQAFSRMAEAHPSGRVLELTPGQVVMGEIVKRVDDREVVVRIANQLLRAVTEVPLATQKHHWFQVQSDPSHLVLKVVTNQHSSNSAQPILPTATALLQNWGMKATKLHVRTAQWLMQQGLPLSKQNVEQVASLWQNLGHTAESEQTVMLTLSKRLPLNTSIVTAIHQFLTGPTLTRQLTELASQLNQWVRTVGTHDEQTKIRVDTVLKQIESLLSQQRTRAGTSTVSSIANHTVSSQSSGSVPDPHNLSRSNTVLREQNGKVQSDISRSVRADTPVQLNDTHSQELMQQAAKGVNKEPTVTASFMQKWLQALGINREGELSRLIRTTAGMDTNVSPEKVVAYAANVKEGLMRLLQYTLPSQVRDRAEGVLQYITGQQLLLSTTNETSWQHVLLQIPFHFTGEQEAAIHVFTRKKTDGQLDNDNCQLLLQLDLERLGENCLVVQIVNRVIHIEWHSENNDLANELHAYETGLRKQLHKIGYHLSGITVKPLSQQAEKGDRAIWPFPFPGNKGVDIRI